MFNHGLHNMKKQCTKCKINKPLSDFWNKPGGKYNKRADCIDCQKKYHKQYNKKNKDKRDSYNDEYRKKNKEQIKEINKKYKQKPEVKKARRERDKKRYKTDINFRLGQRLRIRINHALKAVNADKHLKCIESLGCTIQEFKLYLESKFEPGMTWDNYGNPNGDHTNCWHIDHIKPCIEFDLSDINQQKQCFHYTNLQPLWGKDNLRKWKN